MEVFLFRYLSCYFLFLLLLGNVSNLKAQPVHFRHIGLEEGLPHPTVEAITQDSLGFMWFGTHNGLCRYDGISIKVYQHKPGESLNNLQGNKIQSLLIDEQNTLWVGTNNGLSRYNSASDDFTTFRYQADDKHSIANDAIYDMLLHTDGCLYLATWKGVSRFDRQTGQTQNFSLPQEAKNPFYSAVRAIAEDAQGHLWVGTWNGTLYQMDTQGHILKYFRDDFRYDDRVNKGTPIFQDIMLDHRGRVWLSLWSIYEEMICYDPENQRFKYWDRLDGLKSKGINTVKEFMPGELWVGDERGLQVVYPDQDSAYYVVYDERFPDRLSTFSVCEIFRDRQGGTWLGTWGGGLNYYHPQMDRFTTYQSNPFVPNSLPENYISNLFSFTNNHLLVKTAHQNVFLHLTKQLFYSTEEKRWYLLDTLIEHKSIVQQLTADRFLIGKRNLLYTYHLLTNRAEPIMRFNRPVKSSQKYNDSQQLIFIDTSHDLLLYNWQSHDFDTIPLTDEITKLIDQTELDVIYLDRQQTVWLTFHRYLARFDLKERTSKVYQVFTDDRSVLAHSNINQFYEDSAGRFWMSSDHELILFDRESEQKQVFSTADGLSRPPYEGIVDAGGYLWLTGASGLCRFDLQSHDARVFTKDDGMLTTAINTKPIYSCSSGNIYFGTVKGLIAFNPKDLKIDSTAVPVLVTDFHLFNELLLPGEGRVLQKAIFETDSLSLAHDQNSFSFRFAALDYIAPDKILYQYKLEGADHKWITVSSQRNIASYTKLSPGQYVFRLKACNADGIWNSKEVRISLTIRPPYWRTLWFRLLFVLFMMSILFLAYWLRLRQMRLRQTELETEVTQRTNELRKLNASKDKLLSIIGHDLRNPFHAIHGFSEMLVNQIEELDDQQKVEFAETIRSASDDVSELLENLLHWARSEMGKINYKPKVFNLSEILQQCISLIKPQAQQKHVSIYADIIENELIYADQNMLYAIIRNILSNAVKFTPQNGEVNISTKTGSNFKVIKICDSGVGMTTEQIENLFDYEAVKSQKGTVGESGTGLGMFICKEFVDYHKGHIRVNSTPGQGTCFVVQLPLHQEFIDDFLKSEDKPEIRTENKEATSSLTNSEAIQLLIVDDSPSIRRYLVENLKDDYTLLQAESGQQAYQLACEHLPNLIISDVMMPDTDGLSLTRQLKEHDSTSHIPVILLTARDSEAEVIQGLRTGADDYLVKPFNMNILCAKITTLLENRQTLREQFSRMIKFESNETIIKQTQERFFERIIHIIETNLQDPEFTIDQLVQESGVSGTLLRKKLKAVSHYTPNDLLRIMRMKNAARLMKEKPELRISEVCYLSGYNNMVSFRNNFKTHFNMSPSDYKKQHESA